MAATFVDRNSTAKQLPPCRTAAAHVPHKSGGSAYRSVTAAAEAQRGRYRKGTRPKKKP
jgi:hypothetical protein